MREKPAGVLVVPSATLEAECLVRVLREAGLTTSERITSETTVRVVAAGRGMQADELDELLAGSTDLPTVLVRCAADPGTVGLEDACDVAGVLSWDSEPDVLTRAIGAAASGRGLPGRDLHDPDPCDAMTSREIDVLRLVVRGHRDQEIAGLLGISANTVRTHLQHAMWKLNVSHRQAAAAAVRTSARLNAEGAPRQPHVSGETS